ncbi:hypothetical protein [Opitutus sp. ER46]|uniref:hypothetical protein n=1 Tax=Opitutus sp. ER46 TaxID=2161864 RepID=UPI000D31E46E|nr:hypothetical protein [Opitutus sp. ER46]PTX94284.1 hypothetical protein DB354_11005 [Opitutus sp. ER46]
MDDELQSLEAELQALRPAAPSAALRQRIAAALAEPAGAARPSRSRWWWLALVPVPLAATVAVLLTVSRSGPDAPAGRESLPPRVATPGANTPETTATDRVGEVLKPIAAAQILYAANDEGLVLLEDGTPARRERLRYVETVRWRDPRTNAALTWRVPREEVRITPVRYQ